MKKLSFIVFFFLISSILSGQITYEKAIGTPVDDVGLDFKICNDMGYIICGTTIDTNTNNTDAYVVRTNLYGDSLWTYIHHDPYSINEAKSICIAPDGGFLVTGIIYKGITEDAFLMKLDIDGNLEWFHHYQTNALDEAPFSILPHSDSACVIAASVWGDNWYSSRKACLIGADFYGNKIFVDTVFPGEHDMLWGNEMILSFDHDYIFCGGYRFWDVVGDFAFLMKRYHNCVEHWRSIFGSSEQNQVAISLCQSDDQGYAIAGNHYGGLFGGSSDILLIKTDDHGYKQWRKRYITDDKEYSKSIAPTPDGGFLICGYWQALNGRGTRLYLVRTDGNGDTLWTRKLQQQVFKAGNKIKPTSDGGYMIVGATRDFGMGDLDIYLLKLDANGTVNIPGASVRENPMVNCYPNPFHDVLYLSSGINIQAVKIYALSGLCVFSSQGHTETLHLEFLPVGLYVVRIEANGSHHHYKIMKK